MPRFILYGLTTISLLAGMTTLPQTTQAAAPMVKTQEPGYYRLMLGDFEVTALSDGTIMTPVVQLLNDKPAKTEAALKRNFLGPLSVETSVNAFLVNTGSKLVLVDTGAAGLFGPTLGNLLNNIKASGYQPEQIDEIYLTHLHPDHVGGLLAGSVVAFPNAVVRMDKADQDFWLSEDNLNSAPEADKEFFKGAISSLGPYLKAGKVRSFEGNSELVPGICTQQAHGHTPGHSVYIVESKGEKLVLWGDLMHVAAVQFGEPSVTIKFDSDAKAARSQREQAYADAAKNGYLVGGAHLSFPGLGHLRANGKGYVWLPLNYSSLR